MHARNDLGRPALLDANVPGTWNERTVRATALAAFILVAIVIRILPLTYSHFWDETVFLQHARILVDGRVNYNEFSSRPPLLPFMYAAGYVVWDSIYVANVVQGIVSGLVVLFAFLYMRPIYGTVAALAAAALFALAPYVVERSHDLLTDGPAVTLMLASMWLFDRRGVRAALMAGVVLALAVQMRYTSLFLATYFVLDAFVTRKFVHLLFTGAAAALAVTPYLLWNHSQFGSPVFPFELARRVVQEWTALVPPAFYWSALGEIFPVTVWVLFTLGVGEMLLRRLRGVHRAWRTADSIDWKQDQRVLVLLAWGAAFLGYMLTIPHKEVRYLLPLTIPVLVTAALGAAAIVRRVASARPRFQIIAASLAIPIIVADFGRAVLPIMHEAVDRSVSNEVEIAQYLRAHSSARDTIYAAHNYPVYAFYTERNTVSLLPIQDNFDNVWREQMKAPGFLVYTHPDQLGEIHSISKVLKPERSFLETHKEFRAVHEFATVTIYRYEP